MASSAVQTLEALLQGKKLGSTLGRLREQPRQIPTGVPALDREIGGGWRLGTMSELVGRRGSGRTSVVLRTLAAATRVGQVVALVDTLDRFDPAQAEVAGVDLEAVLWVRGAPVMAETARPPVVEQAVKQAIRACDLILRAGGFTVVVLDLADVAPRRVQAVPAISWLRLAHNTEGRDTVCLLTGESPMGRSANGVSVLTEARPIWTGTSAQSRRLAGLTPTFRVRAGLEVARRHEPVAARLTAGWARG